MASAAMTAAAVPSTSAVQVAMRDALRSQLGFVNRRQSHVTQVKLNCSSEIACVRGCWVLGILRILRHQERQCCHLRQALRRPRQHCCCTVRCVRQLWSHEGRHGGQDQGSHQWIRTHWTQLRPLLARKDSPLEIVVINDTGGVKQASHLLKYDSMLGTFNADVKVDGNDGISVDGKTIKVVSDRNPLNLPWGEMNIDLVIKGTGVFVDEAGAGKHLQAGAKKVLITAPGKGAIPTYVVGMNEQDYKHTDKIISNASCTTNCLASFVKVLDEKFGIIKGTMTTTHSYTGDQRLLTATLGEPARPRSASCPRPPELPRPSH